MQRWTRRNYIQGEILWVTETPSSEKQKEPSGMLHPPMQAWTSNPLVVQENAFNNINTDTELSAVHHTQGNQSAVQMTTQVSLEQEVDKYMHLVECANSMTKKITDIIQPIVEKAISRRLESFVTTRDHLVETVASVVKKWTVLKIVCHTWYSV